MGKEEKLNKNSAWFKKHHPELQVVAHKETVIPVVEKPHLHKEGFIKRILRQLSPQRAT